MAPSFQYQPTRAASDRPASLGPRRRYAAIAPSVRLSLLRRRQALVNAGRAKPSGESANMMRLGGDASPYLKPSERLGGNASAHVGGRLSNHDRDAV